MGKHAEWRKLAKKLRRKRIRTAVAVARDKILLEEQEKRERSPTYKAWLEEQKVLEEFQEAEENRLAMHRQALWKAEEEAAMMRWREKQSRIAQAKAEQLKKEFSMREEWERGQRKLEEAKEAHKKLEDEKKRKKEELMAQIDAYIEGKAKMPGEAIISSHTHPGAPECPFFSKTGACRFRDSCSRNHVKPGISRVVLIPNFYDHFGLQSLHQEEYDTDLSLEFEDSETYQHFKEFYKDVLPEFERCGQVIQFRVCTNEEPHLRGNVYVEFQSRRHALKALRTFQGRFYAGRRLNVEFTNIPSWKNAICGLYHRKKCPKGKTCNFLHVFKNPNNAFKICYSSSRRQFSRSRSRSPQRRSRSKEWNWSDGSDTENDLKTNSRKLVSKNYDTGSENSRKSRSSSPQPSKHRERSRERKKKRDRKQRSRSRSYEGSSKRLKDHGHDESSRRSKKDYKRSDKDTNGKEESCKNSKKNKDFDRKSSNKDDYRSESSSKKKRKEDNGDFDKYKSKSKESHSYSKHGSD